MEPFTHLHVHSEYSLLDGAARIEDLVKQAAEYGMQALALTDHGVMYGAIPFYKACKNKGIRPIIGCEVYYTPGSLKDREPRDRQPIHHLILLCKNRTGYRNLLRLVTVAHLEGFHYKPRIDMNVLRKHAEGLVCLSACLGGEIPQLLLQGRKDEAKAAAEQYHSVFGEDFYLELQDHGLLDQKKINRQLMELSRDTGIPLVATNDVHYIRREEAALQDVLICIGTGKTVEDSERLRMDTDQLYLKNGDEMNRLFAHVPEALANTAKIAAKCDLELELGTTLLPAFRPPEPGRKADDYLAELCEKGLLRRYERLPDWDSAEYRRMLETRLAYELKVIRNMGYSDYFLIVWDFVRHAKERGIAVGPGRGSSAGSLVAYVLEITDVDPIRHKLLFERFLNPERVTMPDIDIDFSDIRRDEVIEYVAGKYGRDRVAQIITFGTMAARAAVRDVGRALNLPYHEVDRTAKLIPNRLGMTIERALRESPKLKDESGKNRRTAELIRMALQAEGLPRHASTHAAGVVISADPLTDHVPLQQGSDKAVLTQYSMEHLEAVGLLKMDFLGLRTLSIIERTLQWIREGTGEIVDFQSREFDDPSTYAMLGKGDTTGIFQLESAGMRRVLRQLKPTEFEDIVSVLALYRPGPMEFIPRYIEGKQGKVKIEYPHPSLKPILADTYGIIVYQEQIMQIAAVMAGFSLGEADLLRRAVSKKKRDVLDREREHFVRGALAQGHERDVAERVYDMIVRFADYGFPRAHAAAYGVLAYQIAFLKANWPVEFMASMLTSVTGNHGKTAEYVEECRRMGIRVLPPDVNESGVWFTPVRREQTGNGKPAIRLGLSGIKNVGSNAIQSIMNERRKARFEGVADFCRRVDLKACNKRVMESLIQAGAMDGFPEHRAQLVAMLDEAIEAAAKWKKEREDLQLHLFGLNEQVNWTVEAPDIQPYTSLQQLELERALLGFFLSGHPLDAHDRKIRRARAIPLQSLPDIAEGKNVRVAGMIASCKPIVNRKGKQMAFLELEDRVAKVEVVLFPEVWRDYGVLAEKGNLVLLEGKVQHDDEDVKILASRVQSLEHLPDPSELPAPVYIKIPKQSGTEMLEKLRKLLRSEGGDHPVILFYEADRKLRPLDAQYCVSPTDRLRTSVEELLGLGTFKLKR